MNSVRHAQNNSRFLVASVALLHLFLCGNVETQESSSKTLNSDVIQVGPPEQVDGMVGWLIDRVDFATVRAEFHVSVETWKSSSSLKPLEQFYSDSRVYQLAKDGDNGAMLSKHGVGEKEERRRIVVKDGVQKHVHYSNGEPSSLRIEPAPESKDGDEVRDTYFRYLAPLLNLREYSGFTPNNPNLVREEYITDSGRQFVSLSLLHREVPRTTVKVRIDPSRGYLPIYLQIKVEGRNETIESVYEILESRDMGNGFYFARNAILTTDVLNETGEVEREIVRIGVDSIDLNKEIPSADFEVSLTKGMVVDDRIAGLEYIVADGTKDLVADGSQSESLNRGEIEESVDLLAVDAVAQRTDTEFFEEHDGHSFKWLLVCIAVLVSLGAAFCALMARSRRGRYEDGAVK